MDRSLLKRAALGSLIPWAVFLAGVSIAATMEGPPNSVSISGLLAAAPGYLLPVALPTFLLLTLARRDGVWIAIVTIMTAVAVFASVTVGSFFLGDPRAPILWGWWPFTTVAVPLAVAVWVGQRLWLGPPAAGWPRY